MINADLVVVSSAAISEVDPGVAVSRDYGFAYIKHAQRKVLWIKIERPSDGGSTHASVDMSQGFGGREGRRLI